MRFFKSLFSKKTVQDQWQVSPPPAFAEQVGKAIVLLSKEDGSISNEQVMMLFTDHGISQQEAIELILFLPIAFIRHWLPDLNWHNSYKELTNGHVLTEKKYSETPSFQIIWKVTGIYFQHSPDHSTIIKIGGRSAEFHAINQLLNDGGKLDEIELARTLIVR